jgi:hypothetical protein
MAHGQSSTLAACRRGETAIELPAYAAQPPGLMFKLIGAWAAMGFRRPKVAW